jgi:hypothetical protein
MARDFASGSMHRKRRATEIHAGFAGIDSRLELPARQDPMKNLTKFALCLSAALLIAGCDQNESTSADEFANTPSSPGGAPSFGSPSGMGFSTGDAAQAGGQGGGLMGFHHTGEAGTSGTITQKVPEDLPAKE